MARTKAGPNGQIPADGGPPVWAARDDVDEAHEERRRVLVGLGERAAARGRVGREVRGLGHDCREVRVQVPAGR